MVGNGGSGLCITDYRECNGLVDIELLGVLLPDVGSANLCRAPTRITFLTSLQNSSFDG